MQEPGEENITIHLQQCINVLMTWDSLTSRSVTRAFEKNFIDYYRVVRLRDHYRNCFCQIDSPGDHFINAVKTIS